MSCAHARVVHGKHYSFAVPVNTGGVTEENRAAHGGVSYDEICVECKAVRRVNRNGRHFECSAWVRPAAREVVESWGGCCVPPQLSCGLRRRCRLVRIQIVEALHRLL
jgi:hypothetical protein